MRRRYGLVSGQYDGLLTVDGLIISHHDRDQMAWLHPGARVVEIPPTIPADACQPILFNPDYLGAFDQDGNVIRGAFHDQS